MTPLLSRAATCAGLAACGWSTLLAAQSTDVAVPQKTELRRAVTPAPLPGPVIQQSPNGLYKLSITDGGIELSGPKGTVKIGEYGIQIGGPGTMQINVESGGSLRLRSSRDAEFLTGVNLTLKADGDMQVGGNNMQVKGRAIQISGDGPSSLTAPLLNLGCASGRPAARQGDQLQVGGNSGVIAIGSPRVLVC